ncbi:MAG: DUF2252 family protein [Kofleriaceae bacterium]
MAKQRWSRVACAALFATLWQGSAPAGAAVSRTGEVVALLTAANAGLSAADRAEKYAAMKASPFAFFRGSNPLFWHDLATSPELGRYGGTSATRTFLCGDLHTDNFGSFDDDQDDLVYAINDFDEAVIGDYQLDLWRGAVSVVLVARANGLARSVQASALDAFTEAYLDAMASYATSSAEVSRKVTAANSYGLLDDFLRQVAADQSRVQMLNHWTVKVAGVRRLNTANDPDLAAVSASVDADVRSAMTAYRATLSGGTSFPSSFFAVKSVAQRLHAGLGSLGSPRYYVLIEGATSVQDDDRILDLKAQSLPSAAAYLPAAVWAQTQAVSGGDQALRTVQAAKALGYRVDDLLGYLHLSDGRAYSVRERSPHKATFDVTTLTTSTRLLNLAAQWGDLLATGHARADRDWNPSVFPASLDAEIDALTDGDHAGARALIRTLATDYADQVELDYASFVARF